MQLIPAKIEDFPSILKIIREAQIHLASQNIDQWQDGYPNEAIIQHDILNQNSFVVENESKLIMGIAMFTTQAESSYSTIEGAWLTKKNAVYGVIHRMAVGASFRKQGVAKFIFKACEQKLKESSIASMRIDTHEDNTEMQALLKKLGYVYCGVIYLENDDKRLAFEKVII